MRVEQNYDLTKLNTFGVSVRAKFFVEIKDQSDLEKLLTLAEFKENKKVFLGGGSNVLFTEDFDGIVILNKLKGIDIVSETETEVMIRAMSGEIWHDLVLFVVDRGYWGIENLAFIPGTVGAAPIQNIGAYGADLKNTLESVEVVKIETGEKEIFNQEECRLGYRDSIFKNELRGKYFIYAITLKLSKIPKPKLDYKHLKEYLSNNKIEVKNSKDISDAVTSIRRSKLPDPAVISNAGSFFKNVFVSKEKLDGLLQIYPDMPYFKEDKIMKIPAAWLIEQCGWKGVRAGDTGVHEHHALVLVNYGGAKGEEIKKLADEIIDSVNNKFGLKLTTEVNLI